MSFFHILLFFSQVLHVSLCEPLFDSIQGSFARRYPARGRFRASNSFSDTTPFRSQQENDVIADIGFFDDGTSAYNPPEPRQSPPQDTSLSEQEKTDAYDSILLLGSMNSLWSDYVDLKLKLEALEDRLSSEVRNELYDKITLGLSSLSIMLGDLSKELSDEEIIFNDEEHQDELRAYSDDFDVWLNNYKALKHYLEDAPTSDTDFLNQIESTLNWTTTAPERQNQDITDMISLDSESSTTERENQDPAFDLPSAPGADVPLVNDLDARNDSFMQDQEDDDASDDDASDDDKEQSHPEVQGLIDHSEHVTPVDDEDDFFDDDGEEEALPPIVPNSGILSASGFDANNPVENNVLSMDEAGLEMTPVEDENDQDEAASPSRHMVPDHIIPTSQDMNSLDDVQDENIEDSSFGETIEQTKQLAEVDEEDSDLNTLDTDDQADTEIDTSEDPAEILSTIAPANDEAKNDAEIFEFDLDEAFLLSVQASSFKPQSLALLVLFIGSLFFMI